MLPWTQIQVLISKIGFKTYVDLDIDPSFDIRNSNFNEYVDFDIDPSIYNKEYAARPMSTLTQIQVLIS